MRRHRPPPCPLPCSSRRWRRAARCAADPPSPEAADQVVVRYRAGTTGDEREAVRRAHGLIKVVGTSERSHRARRGEGSIAGDRAPPARAGAGASVAVSPNSWRELSDEITEEPGFGAMWGLHNTGQSINGISGTADVDIDGLEALRITRGKPDVVVAVIDSGVDFSASRSGRHSLGQSRRDPGQRRSMTTATATSMT